MPGPRSPAWEAGGVHLTRFASHLPTALTWREIPSRHVTLILNFRDPLVLTRDDGRRTRVGSFVTGLQTGPAMIERRGHQAGIHLKMTPTTVYAMFGVPLHLLTGEVVDAVEMLGPRAARLAERLAATTGDAQAWTILRAELGSGRAPVRQPSAPVVWAWERLITTHGAVRVDELVRQSGWSERRLEARFREEIGLPPKVAARLLRFEYAAALLRSARMPLAALAVEAGYYDQAHLNRDFRSLAGCTPGAFRATAT